MSADNGVILRATDIVKNFGATRALRDFSFELGKGEIHALIGENGSGKSTFTSILAGAQREDSGVFVYKGENYEPKNMSYAQSKGICMIAQEMATFSSVSVAYNLFAGNLERFTNKFGFVNERKLMNETREALLAIGVEDISPDLPIDMLDFERKKIVELARAMWFNPEILVIDETTTALAQRGRSILYNVIKKMREENKSVIFISHDLEEIMEICNVVTVMRDGIYIDTLRGDDIQVATMRRLMVGREMTDNYFRNDYDGSYSTETMLDAQRITVNKIIRNLDIQLHKGEILGIGGLADSGMHEIGKALSGNLPIITGIITLPQRNVEIHNAVDAIKYGIGYVSKDRDKEALIQNATILENIEMASYDKLERGGIISRKTEKELAKQQIKSLRIKCVSDSQFVQELSGGNKQKVVFGKWIGRGCDILILDCPTRGIDIGVKAEMYKLIYQMKLEGKAILFISEELPELLGMSDRILIIKDGKISAEFQRSESLTEHYLIEHMI